MTSIDVNYKKVRETHINLQARQQSRILRDTHQLDSRVEY